MHVLAISEIVIAVLDYIHFECRDIESGSAFRSNNLGDLLDGCLYIPVDPSVPTVSIANTNLPRLPLSLAPVPS